MYIYISIQSTLVCGCVYVCLYVGVGVSCVSRSNHGRLHGRSNISISNSVTESSEILPIFHSLQILNIYPDDRADRKVGM